MLSPAKADIVRRDPSVLGLATVLDPEAFVHALGPHVPGVELKDAELTYIRYKPATNCLATYRLKAGGTTLDVYAKAHGPDERVKLQKARQRKSVAGPLGPGRILLEAAGIVVSVFPNDSKLKALRRLGETQALRALLREFLPVRPDPREGSVQTLGYKPERRYVGRLQTADQPCAVLKFYTQAGFQAAYPNANAFTSRAALRIAGKLGASKRRHVLALEWLPGRLLAELISDANPKLDALVATGAALAELHDQEPAALTRRTRKEEAARLVALGDRLGFLRPALADRAERLAKRLAAWLTAQPLVHRPTHGDFYAKQVLVADQGIAILDLDEAVQGDPRADVGNFVAHLERDVIRGRLPASQVKPMTEALLEGYRRTSREPLAASLDAYAAVGLFQLAHHPFRSNDPEWAGATEAILDRVEARLGRSRPRTPGRGVVGSARHRVPVEDPMEAGRDAVMPFLQRALDGEEAEKALKHLLFPPSDGEGRVRLLGIRVVRHKPGRRCLVEYETEVEGPGVPQRVLTLLGKARARGPDVATHRLCESFWQMGFHGRSADGISVPQPLGVVPEFHMWFQRKVPGTSAARLLVEDGGVQLARRIAEAIHKLHRARVAAAKRHTMADELRILEERLARVAEERPAWRGRIDRVLTACHRLADSVPEPEMVGIHRDFYPDQVIVEPMRLHLVDFDLYCEGDPALDLGNFVGHLREQALRTLGAPEALADREAALVGRYLEVSGKPIGRAVEAYTTLTLVRHISISTQFTERRPFTESLLILCEERLGVRVRPWESIGRPRGRLFDALSETPDVA